MKTLIALVCLTLMACSEDSRSEIKAPILDNMSVIGSHDINGCDKILTTIDKDRKTLCYTAINNCGGHMSISCIKDIETKTQ